MNKKKLISLCWNNTELVRRINQFGNGVEKHTILQLRAKIRKNTLARSPEVVLRALLHLWVEALSGRDTSPDIVDHLSLSHRRREKNSLSFLFFLHPLYLPSFHAETGHGVEHLAPKWTGIKMFSALCKKKKICKRKKNDTWIPRGPSVVSQNNLCFILVRYRGFLKRRCAEFYINCKQAATSGKTRHSSCRIIWDKQE